MVLFDKIIILKWPHCQIFKFQFLPRKTQFEKVRYRWNTGNSSQTRVHKAHDTAGRFLLKIYWNTYYDFFPSIPLRLSPGEHTLVFGQVKHKGFDMTDTKEYQSSDNDDDACCCGVILLINQMRWDGSRSAREKLIMQQFAHFPLFSSSDWANQEDEELGRGVITLLNTSFSRKNLPIYYYFYNPGVTITSLPSVLMMTKRGRWDEWIRGKSFSCNFQLDLRKLYYDYCANLFIIIMVTGCRDFLVLPKRLHKIY